MILLKKFSLFVAFAIMAIDIGGVPKCNRLGEGIQGITSASKIYFKTTPNYLTIQQTSLIAVILPNPRKLSPLFPSKKILSRSKNIELRILRSAILFHKL